MNFNGIKKYEVRITQCLRWSIFILASLAFIFKFAEASAYETTKILMKNPEVAEHSYLVTNGYLIFR
ncbi:hypothetical protein A9Q91_03560 [Candidatus Gracilibacteria bacterium 28_42_T64]|nr:hypothetical protein A9Q91_03560 [Candidatus Gracilibacteria bacterium 28_42_T64]